MSSPLHPDAAHASPFRAERNDGFTVSACTCTAVYWLLLTAASAGLVWPVVLLAELWHRLSARYASACLQREALRTGPDQLPQLHARLHACAARLGAAVPACWVAPAGTTPERLRLLRRHHLVLDAELLDLLYRHHDALDFHLGHELARARQRRRDAGWWRRLVGATPLIGYARARAALFERDRHGAACCTGRAEALRALVLLGAGRSVGKGVAADTLAAQDSGGFFASLLSLTAERPSLAMRIERLRDGHARPAPSPHPLAWLAAACMPRLGFGLAGGALAGALVLTGAALAVLPAYAEFANHASQARLTASLARAYSTARDAARHVEQYVAQQEQLPLSVQQAGFDLPADGAVRAITIAQAGGAMTVRLSAPYADLQLYLVPSMDPAGAISWRCTPGPGIVPAVLPAACREADPNRL